MYWQQVLISSFPLNLQLICVINRFGVSQAPYFIIITTLYYGYRAAPRGH